MSLVHVRIARPPSRFAALVLILLSPTSSLPLRAADPPSGIVTLADVLRAAAERSHASVTAGLDVASAREGTNRARAPYWPSVTVSGGWNARDHEVVAIFDTPSDVLFRAPGKLL